MKIRKKELQPVVLLHKKVGKFIVLVKLTLYGIKGTIYKEATQKKREININSPLQNMMGGLSINCRNNPSSF